MNGVFEVLAIRLEKVTSCISMSYCKRDLVRFMTLYPTYILLYIHPEDGFKLPKHVAINCLK